MQEEVIGYTESDVDLLLKLSCSIVNKESSQNVEIEDPSANNESSSKRLKLDSSVDQLIIKYPWIKQLTPYNFDEPCVKGSNLTQNMCNSPSIEITQKRTYIEHLLNAIGHPNVLKSISSQFLNNVQSDTS